MLNKSDLARLAALAGFLFTVLMLVLVIVKPPTVQTVIPTAMLLPSQELPTVAPVAVVPTDGVTADALSQTSPASNDGLSPNLALRVTENVSDSVIGNESVERSYAVVADQQLPTAFPFPTVSLPSDAMANPMQQAQSQVPNQLVISFEPGTSQAEQNTYLAELGAEVQQRIEALNVAVVNISQAEMSANSPSSYRP